MCEIFATSKDYANFYTCVCKKCKHDSFDCKIADKIALSYFNSIKFPKDKVKRKDGEWTCKGFK